MKIRLDVADARFASIEKQTSTRLDVLEARPDTAEFSEVHDTQERSKTSAFGKCVKESMESLMHQLEEVKASPPRALAQPQRGGAYSSTDSLEPIVKIGGVERETPRGQLMSTWTTHIRSVMQRRFDLRTSTSAPCTCRPRSCGRDVRTSRRRERFGRSYAGMK